jgi:hypothetical protein
MPDTDIGRQLLRRQRLQTWAMVLLYLVVVVALMVIWRDASNKRAELQREEARSSHALCALRGDLEQRAKSATDYLKEHPQGLPGIPASIIKSNLAGQRHSIAALSGLECK